MTVDVDILVAREGLDRFRQHCVGVDCLGVGWIERFSGSRDAKLGVPIDFVVRADVASERDGISVLELPSLVELELASGMTAPERLRDLDDVIQLIRINALPRAWGDRLSPWVRAKFDELWGYAQIRRGDE